MMHTRLEGSSPHSGKTSAWQFRVMSKQKIAQGWWNTTLCVSILTNTYIEKVSPYLPVFNCGIVAQWFFKGMHSNYFIYYYWLIWLIQFLRTKGYFYKLLVLFDQLSKNKQTKNPQRYSVYNIKQRKKSVSLHIWNNGISECLPFLFVKWLNCLIDCI